MNQKQKDSAKPRRFRRKIPGVVFTVCAGIAAAHSGAAQSASSSDLAPGSQPLEMHRVFGIVKVLDSPTLSERVAPLSTKQKYESFVKIVFDPGTVAVALAGAVVSAGNTVQPAYCCGAGAFGQKVGAVAAGYASDSLFARALLPSLLHQDPRIFVKRRGSVRSRLVYSLTRTFVGRTDSGRSTLNTSVLIGYAMATALSNTYYPDRNRNASDSASRYGIALGINAGVNVFLEFWPRHH